MGNPRSPEEPWDAADALLKGLRLAIHHLEHPSIPITPDSLETLRVIAARAGAATRLA